MAFFQFKRIQEIPAAIDEIWDFISTPAMLKEITPPYMGFDIVGGDLPHKMYPGMIISYKVSPLLGIRMTWVTEITHVKEKQYFVDEQRIGPYAMWHHEHHITPTEHGVLMTDIVSYRPPFGFLGRIANAVVIRRRLEEIFDYRKAALIARFGRR